MAARNKNGRGAGMNPGTSGWRFWAGLTILAIAAIVLSGWALIWMLALAD